MTEVWCLGAVYLAVCQTCLISIVGEYVPYFHGNYTVLPYVIIVCKINTGTSHTQALMVLKMKHTLSKRDSFL